MLSITVLLRSLPVIGIVGGYLFGGQSLKLYGDFYRANWRRCVVRVCTNVWIVQCGSNRSARSTLVRGMVVGIRGGSNVRAHHRHTDDGHGSSSARR
jgi:hypothetical protein